MKRERPPMPPLAVRVKVAERHFEAMMLHASGWYILWGDGSKDGPFKTIGGALKMVPKITERQIIDAYFGKNE